MAKPTAGEGRWIIKSRKTGFTQRADLILEPELSSSPMVDDYYDEPGEDQLAAYVRYVREKYPQYWDEDAVPIYWSVSSKQGNVAETAPFQPHLDENFLTFFEWPADDNGSRVDWFTLPVNHGRFPEFAKALGWVPSPLQRTAPLRSIMASKRGHTL